MVMWVDDQDHFLDKNKINPFNCYEFIVEYKLENNYFKLVLITENVSNYNTPEYNKELLNWIRIDKKYYANENFECYDDLEKFIVSKDNNYNDIDISNASLNNKHEKLEGAVKKGSSHLIIFITLRPDMRYTPYELIAHEAAHAAFRYSFDWNKEGTITYKELYEDNEKLAKMTGLIANEIIRICKDKYPQYF